jgi:hypothetical protein
VTGGALWRAGRLVVALVLAVLALAASDASSALARRARPPAITTRTLDVIGPRSTASVRAWLGRSAHSLEACRGAAATVSLTFAIAPDGSLLDLRAREGEGLDPDADRKSVV